MREANSIVDVFLVRLFVFKNIFEYPGNIALPSL